tara:strand:+ start:549 stop:1469 length:921 start_codon:yes stop_codon:yes gene_type:complete
MSSIKPKLILYKISFYSASYIFILFGLFGCANTSSTVKEDFLQIENIETLSAVAALGKLSPLGDIRKLAAPVSNFGGTPRILKLLINEGEAVSIGQELAVFDNQAQILSDLGISRSKYSMLEKNIFVLKNEILRYKSASLKGASPLVLLEKKEQELIKLQGQKDQVFYEIEGLKSDYNNTKLLSPINGTILRIHSRVGERPGANGVLEIGDIQSMQALVEVYESDISRIKLGQKVTLISENGGFKNTLIGNVIRISPQVRQREVLSTDPTGDADARIVEVQVKLSPKSVDSVKHLTGIKVIARFIP